MEPGTKATLDPDDLTEIDHGKKRVGTPEAQLVPGNLAGPVDSE